MVSEFYAEETKRLECPIELRDIVQISQQLTDDVDDYKHSMLQTAIAGIAIS